MVDIFELKTFHNFQIHGIEVRKIKFKMVVLINIFHNFEKYMSNHISPKEENFRHYIKMSFY